jgi:hypothetical protein
VDVSTWLELISTSALVGGVIFAGVEWRSSRLERRKQQQVMLLRSFDSPTFTRAMRVVLALPDDATKEQIDADPELADLVWFWLGVTESLGELVHDREIPLQVVDDTISGPILMGWSKLSRYAAETRQTHGRDTWNEWGQWLAEQIGRLEHEQGRTPAYIREADWRP